MRLKRREFAVAVGMASLAGCSTGPTEKEQQEYEEMENTEAPTVVETGHKYDPELSAVVVHADIKNDTEFGVDVDGEIVLLANGTKIKDVLISDHIEPYTTSRIYDRARATKVLASDITNVEFRDMTHRYYPAD